MPEFRFTTDPIERMDADLLIIPFYQGPEAGPGMKEAGSALDADLVQTLRDNRVKGKFGDTFSLSTLGRIRAKTVILFGLGPRKEVDTATVRRAGARLGRRAADFPSVASFVHRAAGRDAERGIQAFAEGLVLGSYRFERYKADSSEDGAVRELGTVVFPRAAGNSPDARRAAAAAERGWVLARAANWARDLVNTPAADATPAFLAGEAQRMATALGLEAKVWKRAELEKGGFGGILAVGRGSPNEPRLVELRYRGGGGAKTKPIAITGKGVTFDSGGLSIKDAKGMEWMKADMAGAAAALGAMRAIAELKPKVDVIAAIPLSENMPSGSAVHPGDVVVHRGGKTSEVLNTDAEGRLVLADALAFLSEQDPQCMVDAATLTGACMVALGDEVFGVMGNDRAVVREILSAGEAAGEPGWELPLWRGYRKHIDSPIADVKNIGTRYGGAIQAGLFLAEFVGEVPWAHLDIAGTAYHENGGDYGKGATGSPVRTLVEFVERRAGHGARTPARGRTRAGARNGSRTPGRRSR